MSQPKARRASWLGWVLSAVLIIGSLWLWTQRQYVVDAIQYYQFTPSEAVRQVAEDAGFTDDAVFTFYATRPVIESSSTFNQHCERREADSPILGCYSANRIYIFDITDDRLEGIKVVTAAHELLHAEYERLPSSERERLDDLLEKAYQSGTNPKLEERMAYYEKTQPGQNINELHSIVGTEFASIDPELEAYYTRFFKDRQALVTLHEQVESQFEALSEEADLLVSQIEQLALTINEDTRRYNDQVESLNSSVQRFNDQASRSGGFTTQQEFQAARQDLVDQSEDLASFRQAIQASIAQYKTLLAKLDSINAESASLNQSLDSTLSEAPSI
jgi:hypothetical protein